MLMRKRHTVGRWVRLGVFGLSAVASLVLFVTARPGKAADHPPPAAAGKPASSADPLEEPLKLIAQAKAAYAGVRDYSCLLVKRELLKGGLSPTHVIVLKVRTDPFSVSMLWQEPKELQGQEVCYVTGKHDGKMRVRAAGLLGAVGHVSLALDDPRALRTSRHRITEAGLGHLIEQCHRGWPGERKLGLTQVRLGNYTYANRACRRVEMIHPRRADGQFMHHRNVLYFDKENHLPIRVENYDWPKKPGAAGELLELYSYVNLKLNVGLGEETFRR